MAADSNSAPSISTDLRGFCDRIRNLGHVLQVDQLKDDNHVGRQHGVGEEENPIKTTTSKIVRSSKAPLIKVRRLGR